VALAQAPRGATIVRTCSMAKPSSRQRRMNGSAPGGGLGLRPVPRGDADGQCLRPRECLRMSK
jgi:hypothetical protein